MSSSKIFKADTLFTPHSLVRQRIDPPDKVPAKPASEPEPEVEATLEEEAFPPDLSQPVEEPIPEPASEPTPPPNPEPAPPTPELPPEPPVDIEAIRQEGYHQGVADCAAQMQARFEQSIHSFAEACQKIDELHRKKVAGSHGDLINLVMTLTEKIVDLELSTPRNQIARTLEAALEQAIASEEFHVSLHPDDLAHAEEKAPALIHAIRGLEHLIFKADPNIRPGGCLLESVTCTVDATIDGKLESARELLTEHPELLIAPEEEQEERNSPEDSVPADAAGP